MMEEIRVPTPDDWTTVAEAVLSRAADTGLVLLEGEIGAGKTTLVQAICRLLGVKDPVTSPTFSIVNEYRFLHPNGTEGVVFHLDLYRLEDPSELDNIGLEEYLFDGDYCFVEWPEIAIDQLPEDAIRLRLEHLPDSGRKILFL